MVSQLSELHDSFKKEERQALLQWLSRIPYKEHHKRINDERLSGSGDWLLKKQAFAQWIQSSSSSIFWLHGAPGAGKTHLTSLVIDRYLKQGNRQSPMGLSAFFYCNLGEAGRSSPEEILRCLLKQLCSATAKEPIREPVATTYRRRKEEADDDGGDPFKLSIKECVSQIVAIFDENPGILVVDALDECDPSRRYYLLEALDEIIQLSSNLVKIFVSSRNDDDIVRRLQKWRNIQVHVEDNGDDIKDFVNLELRKAITSGRLLKGAVSRQMESEIREALIKGSQGMFLWASLQIQNITDHQRFKLEADVRAELGKLPDSLKGSYHKIYQQILNSGPQSRSLAQSALAWIMCWQSYPDAHNLLSAIKFSSDDCKYASMSDVLDVCCNLVILDSPTSSDPGFRFAHLSVQEFLMDLEDFTPFKIHLQAAKYCLYIMDLGYQRRLSLLGTRLFYDPLSNALRYFSTHARFFQDVWRENDDVKSILEKFAELYISVPRKRLYMDLPPEYVPLPCSVLSAASVNLSSLVDIQHSQGRLNLSPAQQFECLRKSAWLGNSDSFWTFVRHFGLRSADLIYLAADAVSLQKRRDYCEKARQQNRPQIMLRLLEYDKLPFSKVVLHALINDHSFACHLKSYVTGWAIDNGNKLSKPSSFLEVTQGHNREVLMGLLDSDLLLRPADIEELMKELQSDEEVMQLLVSKKQSVQDAIAAFQEDQEPRNWYFSDLSNEGFTMLPAFFVELWFSFGFHDFGLGDGRTVSVLVSELQQHRGWIKLSDAGTEVLRREIKAREIDENNIERSEARYEKKRRYEIRNRRGYN
ncbi:hypothetical protein BC567DRAFT_81212 [Phyllosticta citribraziliensis]